MKAAVLAGALLLLCGESAAQGGGEPSLLIHATTSSTHYVAGEYNEFNPGVLASIAPARRGAW